VLFGQDDLKGFARAGESRLEHELESITRNIHGGTRDATVVARLIVGKGVPGRLAFPKVRGCGTGEDEVYLPHLFSRRKRNVEEIVE
jgi:hypothetical protein